MGRAAQPPQCPRPPRSGALLWRRQGAHFTPQNQGERAAAQPGRCPPGPSVLSAVRGLSSPVPSPPLGSPYPARTAAVPSWLTPAPLPCSLIHLPCAVCCPRSGQRRARTQGASCHSGRGTHSDSKSLQWPPGLCAPHRAPYLHLSPLISRHSGRPAAPPAHQRCLLDLSLLTHPGQPAALPRPLKCRSGIHSIYLIIC